MKPVVFLDIDDVIATGDVWTSSWVIRSFRPGGQPFPEHEWGTVFQPDACRFLKALHDSISPEYVISSSWSHYLSRDDMRTVFDKTGLGFVSSSLHEDWTTPKFSLLDRHTEITAWLDTHSEVEDFVVLDDLNSGHTLHGSALHPRIVFCTSNSGFDEKCLHQAEQIISKK